MGMSVDGFIARANGDIDWLGRPEYTSPDNLGLSYESFTSSIDAIVMGRKSFEKVISFSQWPYDKHLVIVLSTKDITIPKQLKEKVCGQG